jgi:hypothetical protein
VRSIGGYARLADYPSSSPLSGSNQVAAALVDRIALEPRHCVGDSRMEVLSPRSGDASKQRLAHQFMGEGEWLVGLLGARDDYSQLLYLLDDGEKFVNVDLGDCA